MCANSPKKTWNSSKSATLGVLMAAGAGLFPTTQRSGTNTETSVTNSNRLPSNKKRLTGPGGSPSPTGSSTSTVSTSLKSSLKAGPAFPLRVNGREKLLVTFVPLKPLMTKRIKSLNIFSWTVMSAGSTMSSSESRCLRTRKSMWT